MSSCLHINELLAPKSQGVSEWLGDRGVDSGGGEVEFARHHHSYEPTTKFPTNSFSNKRLSLRSETMEKKKKKKIGFFERVKSLEKKKNNKKKRKKEKRTNNKRRY